MLLPQCEQGYLRQLCEGWLIAKGKQGTGIQGAVLDIEGSGQASGKKGLAMFSFSIYPQALMESRHSMGASIF